MIRRTVGENYDDDEGRSICRLDPNSLLDLKLSPGDIARVCGDSDAYVKVWRSEREDWDECEILLDEITRYNAQTDIGDSVTIEKVTLGELEKITVLPYRGDNIEFGSDAAEPLKKQQINKPVQIGSVLATFLSSSEDYLPLVVTSSYQIEPGIISDSTNVEIPDPFLSDPQSE